MGDLGGQTNVYPRQKELFSPNPPFFNIIISHSEPKVNKNLENFLKKVFEKYLTNGPEVWYNKRGSKKKKKKKDYYYIRCVRPNVRS